jgi:hypothetical protein
MLPSLNARSARRPAGAGLRAHERRILEAVCDALIPPPLSEVAPPASALADFAERFVDELPGPSALAFRAALYTLDGFGRIKNRRALHRQDRAQRFQLLLDLEGTRLAPLRLALKVVSGLGLMALYSDPKVRQKLELP